MTRPDVDAARVRATYLVVLGVVVCVCVAAVVLLAFNGRAGDAAAVVGAIGSAAVGALAALARH